MALLSEDRPLQPLGLHDILCGTHDVVHIGMVGALERMLLAQRAALEGAHWFGGVEMVMRRDDVQILAPLPKLGGWWRTAQHIEAHERMVYRRGEHLGLYWHERPPLWGALAHTWHGDRAVVPFPDTTACDIEYELMWVLGRDVTHADSSAAQEAIVGVTLMASVVARDRADDDVRLHIPVQLIINDVVRGQVNMRDVHYPMADVVAHASGSTTLVAGTVFSSGVLCSLSDYGGAWLVPGDEIAIDAGPLGTLRWSMEEWP
jgi:2-keto-4-pentenoate hydratase/2-oxohepta-3-ene-1,7-dioic acid hydratase in catechol pathway